ncbi:MAG: hypothetical protein M3Z16_06585 [Pseudomonadota bacterium]|nr:hypothetical protein [Pseudomonadota bacterium]
MTTPTPNPALVSQREATPLPRLALALVCAAYLLPGLFGRDPWKNADITAFGYMVNIADGKVTWLAPTVGGIAPDGALLPYWLGAIFVKLAPAAIDPAFAARLPYGALLGAALALTWYATYHLARLASAQPLPFAFGGEASTVDYARAIADGALLALIASLGLLQLGHETTPELVQLFGVALFLYGCAAMLQRRDLGLPALALAMIVLGASGAPTLAMLLAGAALFVVSVQGRDGSLGPRPWLWILAAALLAALEAMALGAWANRLEAPDATSQWLTMLRNLIWFTWPGGALAAWTLWQWRRHLGSPHLLPPILVGAVMLAAYLGMNGLDRALMLALPPLAILAAFALPTLRRGVASAIDWFSVFLFSIVAATAWLFYVAMQTGTPAKLAANVAKLSPGYANTFSPVALLVALLATLAWIWLVRWRTGRNRHPLWKTLVLPAGGVTLLWLLGMTILLPPVDNARSYRSLVARIAQRVPASTTCLSTPGLPLAEVAALEYYGGWRVDASTPLSQARCDYLLLAPNQTLAAPEWQYLGRERRLRREDDGAEIYRRRTSSQPAS